jgi:hypothetical protein
MMDRKYDIFSMYFGLFYVIFNKLQDQSMQKAQENQCDSSYTHKSNKSGRKKLKKGEK